MYIYIYHIYLYVWGLHLSLRPPFWMDAAGFEPFGRGGRFEMKNHLQSGGPDTRSAWKSCELYPVSRLYLRYIYLKRCIPIHNQSVMMLARMHRNHSRNLPDSVAHLRQHHAPSILLANYKVPQPNVFRLRRLVTNWLNLYPCCFLSFSCVCHIFYILDYIQMTMTLISTAA